LLLVAYAVPPLIVTARLGPAATAYFSVPWVMANTLDHVALYAAVSLTAEGAADERRLREYTHAVTRRILVAIVPIVVGLMVLAPWILTLYGPEYSSRGAVLLRVLVLASPLKAVTVLFTGMCRAQGRVRRIVAVHGVECVGLLVLAVPFIDRWGATGVGYAVLVAEGLAWLLVAPALARYLSTPDMRGVKEAIS
jgi:O-antigen/teichoic acid export membrane protein